MHGREMGSKWAVEKPTLDRLRPFGIFGVFSEARSSLGLEGSLTVLRKPPKRCAGSSSLPIRTSGVPCIAYGDQSILSPSILIS